MTRYALVGLITVCITVLGFILLMRSIIYYSPPVNFVDYRLVR